MKVTDGLFFSSVKEVFHNFILLPFGFDDFSMLSLLAVLTTPQMLLFFVSKVSGTTITKLPSYFGITVS